MRIPGSRYVRSAARRARSRLLGRLLVLGYHRIGNGPDPFDLAVRPGRFEAQLDVLARRARVLPLAEAAARLAAGTLPARAVALTFDDGYADLSTRVAPMLAARDMTATAFIASGYIGGDFWWDRLARLASARDPDAPLYEMFLRLEPLGREEREARLAEIDPDPGAPLLAEYRALTADELSALAADGVIEIGAHTVLHPRLTRLDPESRARELRDCKQRLEELTGGPVTAFSYPFGGFSRKVRDDVGAAGYGVGCTSMPELARRRSHRLALPRLWPGDWSPDAFEPWLERWLPRAGS